MQVLAIDCYLMEVPFNEINITNFIKNETGTKQNKYTGMFEGMNLIFIVAESFSEIAVSEELTPTLYKLVHEGFDFTNFYTSNNLSTIGGEFQALTGLYADNGILDQYSDNSTIIFKINAPIPTPNNEPYSSFLRPTNIIVKLTTKVYTPKFKSTLSFKNSFI